MLRETMYRLIAATVVAQIAALTSLADVTLIENGVAKAQIVLPADAHDMERTAADELNLYLQKSTGTMLPIVTTAAPESTRLLLGVRHPAARHELNLSSLAFDGFVISCAEDRLILTGNVPEGTLNAVYALLEDVVGVRWFMPTELGEQVPQLKTVRIPAMHRRVEPRFVNRRNHGIELSIRGAGAAWRQRIRITSHDLAVPFNRYSHNLYVIFRPSTYGETHPEYFPLMGTARRVPDKDNAQHWQPCTTNPEVTKLTIDAARKWFDARPRTNFFSVGMNDSGEFCKCGNCTSLDIPGETFRNRPMVSDRYFTYVRDVANAVMKTHPDRYVTCIAYSVVESPPKHVKLPPNVGVVITQDVAQWHDPEYKQTDMDFASAWARAAGAFGTYDYTGLTWMMPRVYPHAMADSLRFYDRIGAVAVTNEAFPTWWYAAPQMYLRAKLMWDPRLDTDPILDEFYAGFFGPAKTEMKPFYAVLERCLMKPRRGRWFEGLSSVIQQLDLWEQSDLAECRTLLATARQKVAQRQPYAERLEFVARGFGWADAMLEEYWQAQRLIEAATSATAGNVQRTAALKQFLDLQNRRKGVWASIRDDRLVSGIYKLVFNNYEQRLATWQSFLNSALGTGISALFLDTSATNDTQIADLLAKVDSPELVREMHAMMWAKRNAQAPNLCKNPNFEDTAATGPAPQGLDWVATNAPPGWARWALNADTLPRLTWEPTGGREGSRCIRIAGAQDACFIHVMPAEPGELYVASAYARAEGPGKGKARLVVQWKDAEGRWVWSQPRREACLPDGARDWRKLSIAFTVPDGVSKAVILPAAKDQDLADAVWFDDVRVAKVPENAVTAERN